MDYNRETILDELNDFEKRLNEISPVLEDYLIKIARTGDTMFPWVKLKPLLRKKLELVLDDFYETCPTDNLPPLPNVEPFKFEILKTKILEALDLFHSAPFTIQRLCELLTTPRKHYKRTDKFMRGLEKNVLVVSTVEPKSRFDNEVNNNSSAVVNRLVNVGSNEQQSEKGGNSPNTGQDMKLNNSGSQFETFNMLSSSPSIIITEIPSTSQNDKTETDVQDVNSNTANVSNNNANINEMDVSSYRDTHLSDENTSNRHNNHQKNISSPGVIAALNNNSQSSSENFSVFPSPTSVGASNQSNIPQGEKCNVADSGKNFKSRSNEREIDLSRFQGSCDNHLVESAMDIAPSVVVVSERPSSYSQETHRKTSSSRSKLPDSKENFTETTSVSDVKDANLADDDDHSGEVASTSSNKSGSYKENIEADDGMALSGVTSSQSSSSDLPQKSTSLDELVSRSHAMQRDSSVAVPVPVETTVISRAGKSRAGNVPDQDIMDLEPPSKNVHPEFIQGTKTTSMNETEAMEQD